MYDEIETVETRNGNLRYYWKDQLISKRDRDTIKYYSSIEKISWDDIFAAVDDYRLSQKWN